MTQPKKTKAIAIIYQSIDPPSINGVRKPKKESGYKDSGADISFALQSTGHRIVTPKPNPDPIKDDHWVFPDTTQGIQSAIDKGADIIWANTVLFSDHPLQDFIDQGISIIGQEPEMVQIFDDKWLTNQSLKKEGLPIPIRCSNHQ